MNEYRFVFVKKKKWFHNGYNFIKYSIFIGSWFKKKIVERSWFKFMVAIKN